MNDFAIVYFFPELLIHLYFDSVLIALEVGVAVSAQSSGIRLFVTVNAFVGKRFSTIQTITVFAHTFGIMLTVFMGAVFNAHYRLRLIHRVKRDDLFDRCLVDH